MSSTLERGSVQVDSSSASWTRNWKHGGWRGVGERKRERGVEREGRGSINGVPASFSRKWQTFTRWNRYIQRGIMKPIMCDGIVIDCECRAPAFLLFFLFLFLFHFLFPLFLHGFGDKSRGEGAVNPCRSCSTRIGRWRRRRRRGGGGRGGGGGSHLKIDTSGMFPTNRDTKRSSLNGHCFRNLSDFFSFFLSFFLFLPPNLPSSFHSVLYICNYFHYRHHFFFWLRFCFIAQSIWFIHQIDHPIIAVIRLIPLHPKIDFF